MLDARTEIWFWSRWVPCYVGKFAFEAVSMAADEIRRRRIRLQRELQDRKESK